MSDRVLHLTGPDAVDGRRWLLSVDAAGCPLGTAAVRLPAGEGQRHVAELELHVHPAERRRGIGSRLLERAADLARSEGRRSLLAEAEAGTPGASFLAARGFRVVLTLLYARLSLGGPERDVCRAEVAREHAGYHLVGWQGTVPDELAESFAASRRAMDDMPLGEADRSRQVCDVERVRAAAAVVAARGEHLHTVAALAGRTVVGFVEVVVPPDGLGDGLHYGTAVLPEHRGRGLARWMSARAVIDVQAAHPSLSGLLVDTAEENAPMRAVNDALGYRPVRRVLQGQLGLAGTANLHA